MRAQVCVEVGRHGTSNALIGKKITRQLGFCQIKAAVEYSVGSAFLLQFLQLSRGHEQGVHGRVSVGQWSSAGPRGRARLRKAVAAIPLVMMSSIPTQPIGGI